MNRNDTVILENNLPWSSQQQASGEMLAIGTDHLLISGDPAPNELEIRYLDQTFSFRGQSEKLEDGSQKYIVTAEQTNILNDLLGQFRKNQHIDLCQKRDVEASDRYTGLEEYSLLPEAVPDFNFSDIDTKREFLGRTFDLPILITGMTGGVAKGTLINQRLAAVASKFNIPMGVGSQRIALENPEYAKIFAVKEQHPDLFLIGNLGFAQLRSSDYLELCEKATTMIQADALAIHVNVLQEAIQVEGDRDFDGVTKRLESLCKRLEIPVIVKEVGCGMTPNTVQRLIDTGVAAVDIGGKGGTSWGYIEGLRSQSWQTQQLADSFRNWGIPTAFSLAATKKALPESSIVATGGIRDGLHVAKACALGATMTGVGLPFLRASLVSEQRLEETVELFARGLELAMIASGCRSLKDLKQRIVRGLPLLET